MFYMRIHGIICAALLARSFAFSQETLTSIAAVRALSPERADENIPVQLEATVTLNFIDSKKRDTLFIHDSQEGIFLALEHPMKEFSLHSGTRLQIQAHTHMGGFIPILICDSLNIIGSNSLPTPVFINKENLFSPELDCQWVKASGVIVGTETISEGQFIFVVELSGWRIKLLVPANDQLEQQAAKLMQRRVTFEGVASTVFNNAHQMTGRYIMIPSLDFIQSAKGTSQTDSISLMRVDQVLRSDTTIKKLIRVRGVVTYANPNELYLRGEGGSMHVFIAGNTHFISGDVVEVEGFGVLAPFRPELRARQVQLLKGHQPQPLPIQFQNETKDLADLQAELIEVRAKFLGQRENPNAIILQCRTGDRLFEALLPKDIPFPKELVVGATLRLIGTCELTTSHPLPRMQWVDGFRLHLRSSEDLAILSLPPWWNATRLLTALAVVACLGLTAMTWGWTLRRRVVAQTEVIGAQLSREAVLSERRRLARDFHDTLEQELTGVAFQLDNAEESIESTPGKARQSLQLAKKMLRQSREEARISITDLRSALLEQAGLAAAMQETLPSLASSSPAVLTFEQTGAERRMNVAVENHLLRLAREAVANAVNHSGAKRIEVKLAFDPVFVRLTVTDDGRGFDVKSPPPKGHFGLLGMSERANKIGATLNIQSAPNIGTTVIITVPMDHSHPAQYGKSKQTIL
ncbi:MAG: sensor histidine kinase [Verrucomicrobiae bacterium]